MNFELHLILDMVIMRVINPAEAYTLHIICIPQSVNITVVTEITRLNELNALVHLNEFNSEFLPLQLERIREQHLSSVDLLNLIPLMPNIKKGNLIRRYSNSNSNSNPDFYIFMIYHLNLMISVSTLNWMIQMWVMLSYSLNQFFFCINNINCKGYVKENSIQESQLFLRVIYKYLLSHGYE